MNRAEYEAAITLIVKQAMSEYVSWTSREFAALNKAAIDEVSRETARRLYGPPA